ncbi:MAG: hypothetical protein R3285_10585, partial [Kiloniellales bacterium]|nr:hypothetical protein [Kiloniellales bacterium]
MTSTQDVTSVTSTASSFRGLAAQASRIQARATELLGPLALLALRLPVAAVFWRSGRTRVEGWNVFEISETQAFLFEYEFGLPF